MESQTLRYWSVSPEYIQECISRVLVRTEWETRRHAMFANFNTSRVSLEFEQSDWKHSDMAACYFTYKDWTKSLVQALIGASSGGWYSTHAFQFIEELDDWKLRAIVTYSAMQSRWATDGYIVTMRLPNSASFRRHLHYHLKESTVGLIKIDPVDPRKSKLLYPARPIQEQDGWVLERLQEASGEFRGFRQAINEQMRQIYET